MGVVPERRSDVRIGRWRRLARALTPWIARASATPYATHVPVLVGLARLLPVRSVVEFGMGHYSTATFLDPAVFAELVRLDSFETDPAWIRRLAPLCAATPKVRATLVSGPMCAAVGRLNFADYDLVLVDDSRDVAARAATIQQVLRHCQPTNVVVIHDFEIAAYRAAAAAAAHQFTMTALLSRTGVLWRAGPLDAGRLAALNRAIKRHARRVPPDDRAQWLALLGCARG